VSLMTSADAGKRITSLAAHIPRMEGFHRRYMVSGKVLKLWANMVRDLPIRHDRAAARRTPGRCRGVGVHRVGADAQLWH
jgi:hypothetical protein